MSVKVFVFPRELSLRTCSHGVKVRAKGNENINMPLIFYLQLMRCGECQERWVLDRLPALENEILA